ncbi:MAG TPA: hypothetical protein VKA09_00530 [Nitrososphaeraceae archaeon]|nr:hypothetical protein [Nitrososphaeraceae archaeon]
MSLFATAMKLVEVLHCSHHGPKPNSGEQQEKRVVDGKERRNTPRKERRNAYYHLG